MSFLSFQAVFEFLAYKMGVAKGTLTKRMKAVLKKREVRMSVYLPVSLCLDQSVFRYAIMSAFTG